jgi:hypothetical protein
MPPRRPVGADNEAMVTVGGAPEIISPELVLVCPELRERALAQLPDAVWQSVVVQTRHSPEAATLPQPIASRPRAEARRLVLLLANVLVFVFVVVLGAGCATLALTLVADTLR